MPARPSPHTGSLSLLLISAILLGGHIVMRFAAPISKEWRIGGLALLMIGVALAVAGLSSLLFRLATRRSFEWLVAWRYLRVQHKRSWSTLVVGIVLLVIAVGLYVASHLWGQPRLDGLFVTPTKTQLMLKLVALGVGGVAHWVLFFGLLMLFFSLFTTISIFTVFLGLEALVAVLSMMGGFEDDIRQKILGSTAHVVISRPKQVFSDYRSVLDRISGNKKVQAASPYLESEVMITSQSNLSGVLLRGIDPHRIAKVTDLPKYLKREGGSGSLDNLLHPERLAKIPEARFKPMVTVPLGEPPGKAKKKKKKHKRKEQDKEITVETEMWDLTDQIGKKVPPRPLYPGIIIGAELAKNLRLYLGDDVNVVAPLGGMSPAGPIPKSKPFRVAGIFYSGLYEVDNKYAYVTIPSAQRFLGLQDEITGIEVRVAKLQHATEMASAIRKMLGRGGYRVEDWKQRNINLFSALKLEKLVMFIVLTFIVLVASFSIVTNLNMVVLEKVREIAALKAMGATHWSVLRVFLYAGLYIGIIGMLVGVLAGVGICVFMAEVGLPLDPEIYYISQLPVRMDPVDISIVALAGVLISFLATIYPSILAARLRPTDGMRRHEI